MSLMGLTACGTLVQSKQVLNQVHPGMTTEEVSRILGEPDYRRFNREVEEWEYHKWLSGSEAVVIVCFEGGGVVSMDSFERPQAAQPTAPPVVQVPPLGEPEAHPSHPHRLPRMSDAEFEAFYRKVKAEAFSSDQRDMIRALSKSKRLTCRQCAQLLTFFSFEDEQMAAFRWFAPHLVDKENYREIQKQFDFSLGRDEVKKVLGF
ncbi:protein containing SmpA/OmlA domain protein [gut metagenome]|uniref:Protein containing SmpA/OmlA domain protein n=1 Tax=gut metagenome TaxID=749906 RepID=J9GZK2_9ZZZZ